MAKPPHHFVFLIIWVLTVSAGFLGLMAYSAAPGEPADAPGKLIAHEVLKTSSNSIRPKVLLFVHPMCSCSMASLNEYKPIASRYQNEADFFVVGFQPDATSQVDTSTWDNARLIKSARQDANLNLRMDRRGLATRDFGINTSGQVLLYDQTGTLVFAGGVTASRGHEGPSSGQRYLTDFLSAYQQSGVMPRQPHLAVTDVFGCPTTHFPE